MNSNIDCKWHFFFFLHLRRQAQLSFCQTFQLFWNKVTSVSRNCLETSHMAKDCIQDSQKKKRKKIWSQLHSNCRRPGNIGLHVIQIRNIEQNYNKMSHYVTLRCKTQKTTNDRPTNTKRNKQKFPTVKNVFMVDLIFIQQMAYNCYYCTERKKTKKSSSSWRMFVTVTEQLLLSTRWTD